MLRWTRHRQLEYLIILILYFSWSSESVYPFTSFYFGCFCIIFLLNAYTVTGDDNQNFTSTYLPNSQCIRLYETDADPGECEHTRRARNALASRAFPNFLTACEKKNNSNFPLVQVFRQLDHQLFSTKPQKGYQTDNSNL